MSYDSFCNSFEVVCHQHTTTGHTLMQIFVRFQATYTEFSLSKKATDINDGMEKEMFRPPLRDQVLSTDS